MLPGETSSREETGNVAAFATLRRKQLLRQAEGYLGLATAFGDRWPLAPSHRDRLAGRALELLESLERLGDSTPPVLALKGEALRTMERFDEAIEPLRQASEQDPENLHLWLALGWCYKRLGRLDMAIESLEEAMIVDPSQGIIHYNLACYWSLARNVPLALDFLAQALDIDPRYRRLAAKERDFDPIRDEPGFRRLTLLPGGEGLSTRG